ncbi:unnamed protein product [Arctia plantaginis]|uniref:Uncharacterized protein n=1 Tax=Arctia plantaginis TaxID=874455 RepID=A0A8S1AXK5_ARCPL|nr:unnamed protein product [Arctia plantaginis]
MLHRVNPIKPLLQSHTKLYVYNADKEPPEEHRAEVKAPTLGAGGRGAEIKPSAQDEAALKRERIYEGVLVLAGVRPLARTTRVVIKP